MIVTADPAGDFNATSQILRYSALAREVTVPRIPSVTSTILSGVPTTSTYTRTVSGTASGGRTSPVSDEQLAAAQQEIARLTEQVDMLQLQLLEEIERRRAAEHSWQQSEEHITLIEQEIREECFSEMESRIEAERRRWKASWDEEADRNDERVDQKIDLLAAQMDSSNLDESEVNVHEDEELVRENEDLRAENDGLRMKLAQMEREREVQRSPSKKIRVLKARKWEVEGEDFENLS